MADAGEAEGGHCIGSLALDEILVGTVSIGRTIEARVEDVPKTCVGGWRRSIAPAAASDAPTVTRNCV